MRLVKKIGDSEVVKFVIVGVINTCLSMVIMLVMYNLLGISDTVSTFVAYVIGSVVSFGLNRNFTFKSKGNVVHAAIKFAINVAICYVIAYIILKPSLKSMMQLVSTNLQLIDNATMLLGSIIYTACNFVGQKFFAFKKEAVQ